MPDSPDSPPILSQLDESEKGDIITDEELEEIGVAYGSKEKYEEAMRETAYAYPEPRHDAELLSLSEMEERAQELRRELQRYRSGTSQE